jgi:hypothetical protein
LSLKAKELDQAWKKLGMVIEERRDIFAKLYEGGKLIIMTRRSKGSGKLDGQIPHFIRQQMKLDEDQFSRLIACPLQRLEYLQILKDKGLL